MRGGATRHYDAPPDAAPASVSCSYEAAKVHAFLAATAGAETTLHMARGEVHVLVLRTEAEGGASHAFVAAPRTIDVE